MKKNLSLGLCVLLITLLLAACGGKKEAGETASSPAAASDSPTASASASESAKAEEPVTITFMHFKSDVTDGIAKIVEQFEAENPNIKVDVQPVKYDDYYTLLKTKLAGGDVIDVFTLNAGAQTKLFVDGGYLEDLTGQPFLQNFDEGVLKSQATDGKNYVMPVNGGPGGVFYNKKIFSDLGLQVPRTYDAMIAAAEKIKAAGKTPFALGWKDGWPLGMWVSRDLPSNTAFVAGQPDFFEKLETGNAKFTDNPAVKTTIEHAQKIFELGNKDQFGLGYNEIVDLFAKGDVGMMYMGTWPLADIQKKNPDLYNNMGEFPYPFSNDESLNKLDIGPDASLAVGSKSEHKDAALKFLTFMATKEAGDMWVKNTSTLSYVKGTSTDIAPAVNDLKPYIDAGQVYNSQDTLTKTTIDWTSEFDQQLQKLLFKKITADELIKAMDDWIAKNHK